MISASDHEATLQGILGNQSNPTSCDTDVHLLPLGDDPPRDRTAELRVLGFPTRHLGPIQMTTDTALGVTKLVVDDKSGFPFHMW